MLFGACGAGSISKVASCQISDPWAQGPCPLGGSQAVQYVGVPWIASCDRSFPSTLPPKPIATVTAKNDRNLAIQVSLFQSLKGGWVSKLNLQVINFCQGMRKRTVRT